METNGNASLYLRWAYSVGRLSAWLQSLLPEGRRRFGTALSIALLVLLGCWLVGWSVRHFAQARLQPSRATYERLLSQTRAVPGPDGTILIVDPDGAALSLRIDYFKETGDRPSLPFTYEFFFGYDHVDISPEDDPTRTTSLSNRGMHYSPGVGLNLRTAPDPALSTAINHLVDWSIADTQAGAEPRYDIAADGGSNAYFVRCDPVHGWFYLILRQYPNSAQLLTMQSDDPVGDVIPVTTFRRAHLWRYLIDHYDGVRQLAESYLAAKRGEPVKRAP